MENKESEITLKGVIITIAVIMAIILSIILIVRWLSESKVEKALDSYKEAVELCGKENIDKHEYDNGSKDFDCEDYSKAVEIIK